MRICRRSLSLVALGFVLLFTAKSGKLSIALVCHFASLSQSSLQLTEELAHESKEFFMFLWCAGTLARYSFTACLQFLWCLSALGTKYRCMIECFHGEYSNFISKCCLLRFDFTTVVRCLISEIKTFMAAKHTWNCSKR